MFLNFSSQSHPSLSLSQPAQQVMGCVSSTLLNQEDEFGSTGLGHHIVSLTSTTYGLLNLDPPLPPPLISNPKTTPPPQITLTPIKSPNVPTPEIINSWELMAGLLDQDTTTTTTTTSRFRFSPLPPPQPSKRFPLRDIDTNLDNSNPNHISYSLSSSKSLDNFEKLCPPNGENRLVIYTTTLRGVRKTFEDCNVVRAAFEGFGVSICERDISMDRGFREELRHLMKAKEDSLPPRVFLKGRYAGGVEEVMKIVEEGNFGELVQGLPRLNNRMCGYVCDMCGGVRFLPCFQCNGSCKVIKKMSDEVVEAKTDGMKKQQNNIVLVVKCSDCNENGLVLCPICT